MHGEVVVEPDLAWDRARRLLGQGDEDVRRGGVGPALEQAGQQQVALLPAHVVLVLLARRRARAAASGTSARSGWPPPARTPRAG